MRMNELNSWWVIFSIRFVGYTGGRGGNTSDTFIPIVVLSVYRTENGNGLLFLSVYLRNFFLTALARGTEYVRLVFIG